MTHPSLDPHPLVGRRVRLNSTTDQYTRLVPGTLGTIRGVKATTYFIKWDDGSNLSMCPDDGDRFEVLPAELDASG
jgi:hypothetical protein